MARFRPHLLLIAASDSSGGAGLQADLRVCAALDLQPLSAITAITAQSPSALRASSPVAAEVIAAQLEAVEALPIAAVKIGALPQAAALRVVSRWLRGRRSLPVVVDPVFATSGGQALVDPEMPELLRRELLPLASLVTPNGPEFLTLTGTGADEGDATLAAARDLLVADGALLLKGGHRRGRRCEDLLITRTAARSFSHARLPGPAARGTGCTLATACAAGLARGLPLARAVEEGIEYVQRALTNACALGDGALAL
jgi:hydroxymethylpyrimidine/phosphomethylpyrimidine kinase